MPHSLTLITTIAASLGLALILGLIAHRLKLPVLVGTCLRVSSLGQPRRALLLMLSCRVS